MSENPATEPQPGSVPAATSTGQKHDGAPDSASSLAGPKSGTSDIGVEKTRARTGLLAVVAGDVVIALAAIFGVIFVARHSDSSASQIVSILSGAFTAVGTMTTAYFGIKSISNTASNIAGPPTGSAKQPGG